LSEWVRVGYGQVFLCITIIVLNELG
jgi:hypothetical protein